MATPPQHPNASQGNPYAPQGDYAPNQAAYGQNPPYGQNSYAQGQPQPGQPQYAQGQPQYAQGQVPPQAGYVHNPNPYGQPGAAAPTTPPCRICGAQPAGDVTIRQHTGLLVAMRFSKMEGPLCRSCATSVHRDMTTKTLAGGWWSVGSILFYVWFTLLANLHAHSKIKKLPQPTPSPTGVVLDPGKPVWQRPLAYVWLLLPLGWIAAFVANQAN
ncbi:hypothetical protein [Streptomyces sp. SAS_270]|uniref:hypothetical protein n=1 Tax=Streptomyces sp. SAS_270 TaxID=3412748 RepID=UPI00403C3C92